MKTGVEEPEFGSDLDQFAEPEGAAFRTPLRARAKEAWSPPHAQDDDDGW